MKTRRFVMLLVLVVVVSLITIVPVSADGGVIQFKAHMTAYIPLGTLSVTPLPGNRLFVVEEVKLCFQADKIDPEHDYVTGCWFYELNRTIEPSGAHKIWATSSIQELTNLQGLGGWNIEAHGVWTPGTKIITIHSKAEGWGVLEGWKGQFGEFALNLDEYEVDWGHFTPPK